MQTRVIAAVSGAAFAAVLSARAANAATFEITNVGFIGDTTNISGFDNVTGAETGIILLTTAGGAIIPVFCIDLFHSVGIGPQSPPLEYTTGTIVADSSANPAGLGGNPLTAPVPGEIQALVNIGVSDYLHGTGSADIYAGLAGAIWEIEYNTNGNSLTVTGSATVNALIASDVAYAEAHPEAYSFSLFPGANGDAFGAGQAFSGAAPEPGTWAMMLLGFVGLGLASWRRRPRPKLSIVE
jgi:hypothetical protein